MQTEAMRLGTLAAALSKAAPDLDEEQERVALLSLAEAFDLGRLVNALSFPSALGSGR